MIALAFRMGICYDDFVRLNVDTFSETAEAFNKENEMKRRERWNMMRIQTSQIVRPHITEYVPPEKLIPLWFDDEEQKLDVPPSTMSKEEQRKRMQELKERYEQ